MKRTIEKGLFIVTLLYTSYCSADVITCTGIVHQLSNQPPNGFSMSLADTGNMRVCNPETDSHLVTPQNCKHIASLAALAYATGKVLTITIENAPGPNCSEIPDAHDSDVSYVGILPQ